jgi:hypothetical protein
MPCPALELVRSRMGWPELVRLQSRQIIALMHGS